MLFPAMRSADDWIDALSLQPHPEGGHYREVYRATERLEATALPSRFGSPRSFSTSIYFLLRAGETSALHRIRQDELWHFHDGDALVIHRIGPDGRHTAARLGLDVAAGDQPQRCVPAGDWFGAELATDGRFALVGCSVAPGFEFEDLEMAERADLSARFPEHAALIERLTR
jgi:predicted cupin superfamily sugar epimerase